MHGIEGNGKSVSRFYAFPYDTRMADELTAADVEIGDVDELAAKYPRVAADLRAIAESVRQGESSA